MADRESLLAALDSAHEAFLNALSGVDADLVTTPGVMDDWSVRDIVVHIAAWSEHGAHALEAAASGRGSEFDYSTDDTDAMNVGILADARSTAPSAALEREATSFAAFRAAIAALDPGLLGLALGNGDTVAEVITYDGPDHYAEHTEHLRAWFAPEHLADDDDDDEDDEDVLDDA